MSVVEIARLSATEKNLNRLPLVICSVATNTPVATRPDSRLTRTGVPNRAEKVPR